MVEKLEGQDCLHMDIRKITKDEIMNNQLPDFVSSKSTYTHSLLCIEPNEILAHWPKIT